MQRKRNIRVVLAILLTVSTVVTYSAGFEQKKREDREPGEDILWTNPGDRLDFQYGSGGRDQQPQPPFRFISEDRTGTNPKVNVTDGRGVTWSVKWGEETGPGTFCARLVWACGYFAEPAYFVPSGAIEGADKLKRAASRVSDDGSFVNARFESRRRFPQFLEGQGWTWTKNPFLGTRELQGLKVLMLLVSNWDAKDARDSVIGRNGDLEMDSNLAIFADDSTGRRRYLYANDDWGSSMGKWGGFFSRSKWDCKGFSEQTADFVKLDKNGDLEWGFSGKHQKDVTTGITPSDVQWLLTYLGRITDRQIRQGLAASGATPEQTDCYAEALRERIERLQQVAAKIPPTTAGASLNLSLENARQISPPALLFNFVDQK